MPADVGRPAVELARLGGYPLTDFLHLAVALAGQVAEAGWGELLPRAAVNPRRGDDRVEKVKVSWTAPDSEYGPCEAAIVAAGSSVPAVAEEALRAYVAAGGNLMHVRLPWVVSPARRGSRAA